MVERRRLPRRSVVAGFAGLREAARNVIRICRALEILQVTRHAGRGGDVVVIVDVAVSALPRRHGVRSAQSEVHH